MINLTIQTPKGERIIGPGSPAFIVAEMSGNHNQDFNRALKIIDEAVKAGADAVKLQTYTADTLTIDSDKEHFQVKIDNAWQGDTLYKLYQKAHTPWEWQEKLKEYGEKKGLVVFSAPFDKTSVDFLEKMNIPLYKIPSPEIVDIPFLKRVGQTKKPVVMSRGMASLEEIELAVKTLKDNGCPEIAILHCVSAYPAKIEEMNLLTIPDIAERFGVIAGLSDHTLSLLPAIIATALGAKIIEKHFTLERADKGPDSAFSLEPSEFKTMVGLVRKTEKTMGKVNYQLTEGEKPIVAFRKSLFAVKDIKKGEKFTGVNIRSIRPGYGLMPKHYDEVLGKKARVDIERGTPLNWDLIEK